MTSRAIPCVRWRHVRDDVTRDVTKLRLSLQSLSLILVAKQLLWAYLQNRMVDFAHFRQANWYDRVGFTYQKPWPSGQYLSLRNIFSDYHGNRLEFFNSDFVRSLSDPDRLFVPDFIKICWETTEEISIIATNFCSICSRFWITHMLLPIWHGNCIRNSIIYKWIWSKV